MVEWFQKSAGSDIGQSEDDPTMLIVGIDKPDWVRVPAETGHGGQYRCLELRTGTCPIFGHDHPCVHYVLDGPVWCVECAVDGKFLWYRRPQQQ